MYASGRGIKQDYRETYKLFLKSANLGVAEAQFQLGVLYAKGLGVNKDNAIARQWFQKAADQGHQKAIKKLTE
jgi:TPR repeat protein